MEITHYKLDKIKSVILRDLDYVALVLEIDKDRDLRNEYLSQITFGDLGLKYWMFVLEACVLNMSDIRDKLIASKTNASKDTVRTQLLGLILMANPHVYDEECGWDY